MYHKSTYNSKTINLLEAKIGENLHDHRLGTIFLDTSKRKYRKLGFYEN